MKTLLTLVLLCISSKYSHASLAEALNCSVNTKDKQCTSILIGHIDALSNLGIYCADGNTSYSFIIEAWARDMKLNSENNKNTTESLKRTLNKLNLICKNK
jgi:hypothetical protein